MSFERLFFVRHGQQSNRLGEAGLTEAGVEQSREAGEQLLDILDGNPARILSSSATRAMLTSEIIAEIIDAGVVHASEVLRIIGTHPKGIETLKPWIEKAMDEVKLEWNGDLVVVSHQPLVDTVKFGETKPEAGVPNGAVVQFHPGEWNNTAWSAPQSKMLEHMIANPGEY